MDRRGRCDPYLPLHCAFSEVRFAPPMPKLITKFNARMAVTMKDIHDPLTERRAVRVG